jgi:hypothetical protein
VQFTGEALDVGDMSDLIVNFNPTHDYVDLSELFSVGSGEALSDYVQVMNASGNTEVQIDSDGAVGGSIYDQIIATFDGGLAETELNILYDNDGSDGSAVITVI